MADYSYSDDEFDESNEELMRQAMNQAVENNNYMISYFQNRQVSYRGSIPGHITINRNRENADCNLFNDYFSENPTFPESLFRRRFRMGRILFLRIFDAIQRHDDHFVQKRDRLCKLGLSGLQKVTAVFRMLAYGVPADSTDEYIQIGESTVIEALKRFCRAMVEVFGSHYLRAPNASDVARLLHVGKQRGFPGMLGSLDCMHWKWKNCPSAWAGQYAGRSRSPSIILEAVADYDLWIWHAYFGLPGSNNDINVLESSHLFANLAAGTAPPANYVVNGHQYDMGYYLADGIYPKWATLVQTIRDPRGTKNKYFAKRQEACRKDVERAFGVLKSRFAIVAGSARLWRKEHLNDIMSSCIIMHNMIIEDERDLNAVIVEQFEVPDTGVEMVTDNNAGLTAFLAQHKKIKDKNAHFELRNNLIEHLWNELANSEN